MAWSAHLAAIDAFEDAPFDLRVVAELEKAAPADRRPIRFSTPTFK